MTAPEESDGAAGRLDELRRRLYRPDTTGEDLRQYLEERAARALPDEHAAGNGKVARIPRRRRWVPAALVAVLVTGVGLALLPRPDAVAPATASAPPASADMTVERPTATSIPVSVEGVETIAEQYHGRGDARIPLDVSSASFQGGRVLLSVSSGDTTPISWRAIRVETARTSIEETIAGSDASRNGVPAVEEFRYEAAPPGVLDISAAPDVRWTLLIAFPDRRPEPG